jgi:hypothetical protein
MMRTITNPIITLFCVVFCAAFCVACSNLSKSESTLRHNYLAITQPGIDMEEAARLIKKKIKPEGALHVRENVPCRDKEEPKYQKGTHSIKVNLGWYYWGVMETPVYGEWCFNDDRKLVDIVVYKAIDDSK